MRTIIFDASYVLMDSIAFNKERDVKNSNGDIIGGSLFTLVALRNTLKRYPEYDRLIVVWDGGISERKRAILPTYRDLNVYWKESLAMHPDSPATDKREQFLKQKEILKNVFDEAGILQFDIPELEKEDIIPYLLHRDDGNEYVFVTDDHSFNVLLYKNILWYKPFENVEAHQRALMLNRLVENWDEYCYAQSVANKNLDMVKGCCKLVGDKYAIPMLKAANIVGFDEFEKMDKEEIKQLCEENDIPYRAMYANFNANQARVLEKVYGYYFYPGYFINDDEKAYIDDTVNNWEYVNTGDLMGVLKSVVDNSIVDSDLFEYKEINYRYSSDVKDMFE